MKRKWELAKYLLDAKKCVDSILFIEQKVSALCNINLREIVTEKRRIFYISCCIVLDETFPKGKKKICAESEIIRRLYYERDKNYAHKDADYKSVNYDSIAEIGLDLQRSLLHVREACNNSLPSILTLDFVPHDRVLFRLVEGIPAEHEELINQAKYPLHDLPIPEQQESKTVKMFNDIEDIKEIPVSEISGYGVGIENGINDYEGLQNRQDSCVRMNVLFNLDTWVSINSEIAHTLDELKRIGFVDKFGIFHKEVLSDPKVKETADKLLGIEAEHE